jgi:NADH-quinone oxidoreductase subunit M
MSQLYGQLPILSIITFLPLVGALLLLLVPKENKAFIMKAATAIAGLDLLLSLPLWWLYDRSNEGFQFVQQLSWIPSLGVSYKVGIDGISLLLMLLTTLLGFIAILSSWTAINDRVKEYYVYLLLLQTGMMGVFISLDLFLFYVFWEVMLVPMYFLIGIWGGPRRLYAAIKFFLYTLAGSVLMLLGILAIYFHYGKVTGTYTFDVEALHHMGAWTTPEWIALQMLVFVVFFIGFAIKVPMFPFHTWLPDAHVEAPTAGSVILAAVLLKMGTYGFLRFSLPMMPAATLRYMPWLLSLSVIGIIYGAMVAMVQKDWKKLVAYSSVSHLGFCMVGIFSLNWQGLNGGILQMINHGLSTGGLFLIVGLIYERRHTRMISDFGGLSKVMPKFAVYFMIIMLSSIGLPMLNGFMGEFPILSGIFQVRDPHFNFLFGHSPKWWSVLTATGIVLGAAYMLWLYQRTMFGKLDKPENQALTDLNFREVATLVPLVVLCFWIGLYPKPVFDVMEKPVDKIVRQVGQTYYPAQASIGAPAPATAQPASDTGAAGAKASGAANGAFAAAKVYTAQPDLEAAAR